MKFFKKYDYMILPAIIAGLLLNPFSISALTSKYKAIYIEATTGMILNGVTINNWEDAGGFKLRISADDTTDGFLIEKLLGSSTITLTETNPGSNETYVASVTALSIGTTELTNDEVTLAKMASGTADLAYVTDGSGDPALEKLDLDVMQPKSQGEILIYGGSGIPEVLAGAAQGRVLTTNGVTSKPSWDVSHGQQIFTGSGTWTRPDGVVTVRVFCIGGGGGSGASATTNAGGGSGGGGGEYVEGVVTVSGNITVTIGGGGAGASSGSGLAGSPGGNSSFGSLIVANGGTGGIGGIPGAGGAGGTGGTISGSLPLVLENGVSGGAGSSTNTGGDGGWAGNAGAQQTGPFNDADGQAGTLVGDGGAGPDTPDRAGTSGFKGMCSVTW